MKWNRSHLYTLLGAGLLLGGVLLFGDAALAQPDLGLGDIDTGLGQQDIRVIIGRIIRSLLGFLGILAVVIIMYGGLIWMGAGGREESVQKAQRIIINGTIGLVIILSSMAITQFLLNAIGGATGLTTSSSSTSASPPSGSISFNSGFSLMSVSPSGSIPIRNAQVRVRLSSAVDRTTVANNIVVRPVGSTTPEPGVIGYAASDTIITFTPSTPCPSPNGSEGCFDYDTVTDAGVPYEILLFGGLRGTNGLSLSCGPAGCNPAGSFITGALVDLTPPVVTITFPTTGSSVSLNPEVNIAIQVVDDSGVADVEALVDSVTVGTDGPAISTPTFGAVITWIDSGLIAQSTHIINATATDLAGRSADASSITVIARPAHCFDGIPNFGEDDPPGDCGGDPDSLDYCGACEAAECFVNSDCSTGLQCVDGACVLLPEIVSVVPADGAVGNYITLSGINFGNTTGSVRFLGDPDDPTDDLTVGLACSNSWLDDEIVIAVPDPTVVGLTPATYPVGPIEIGIFNGQTDATNDLNGPVIEFEINTVERPGLCSVSPSQAATGDVVSITGTNLGDGSSSFVFFDVTTATSISTWTNTAISLAVPTLSLDPFLKDIVVQKGPELSNPIAFGIDAPDLGPQPTIQYIDTSSAAIDGMITIFGSNFGFLEGNIVFTDPDTGRIAYGSNDFPAACEGGTWGTSSITIKVPSAYTPADALEPFATGNFNIHVVRTDSSQSDAVGFEVETGAPGPGICRITPVSGPENIIVDIYGENFGAAIDTVAFTGGNAVNMPMWTDEHIQATVPLLATTGPLSVTIGSETSNQVAFEVGECAVSPNSCQTSYRCCSNSLTCELVEDDSSECDLSVLDATNYLFEWVTGPVPVVPRVKIACDPMSVIGRTVSPTPWNGRSGGDSVCTNILIAAEFTVNVDNISDTSVLIRECIGTDPDDPCAEVAVVDGDFTIQPNRFEFDPDDLDPSTTYQVTITTGVIAAGDGGLPMAAPFQYRFTTRDTDDPCEVQAVTVFPGRHTLTEHVDADSDTEGNENVELSATGIGDDICVLLDLDGESIAWTTANNAVIPGPFAVDLQPGDEASDQLVIALSETVSSAVSVIATLVAQQINGFSLINVNFTDPVVQNYWPNCQTACINAQIAVQFNVPMLESDLTSSTVHLESCSDELCEASGNTPVTFTLPPLTNDGKDQVIDATPALVAGMFYRVTIDDGVTSASGVGLTDMNYGDSFSWVFRVNPDGALCTIDNIVVSPPTATLQVIGERQTYSSTPYGPPDSCSEGGQRLEWSDYDWAWLSSVPNTAFLLGTTTPGDYDLGSSSICNGSCLLNGSESNVSVCGNGGACTQDSECSNNETCSSFGQCIEYGEQCDDGSPFDPLNLDGCSAACVWEGTDACTVAACSLTGTSCTADTDCNYGDANFCEEGDVGDSCAITGTSCTDDDDCEVTGGSCAYTGSNCCGNGVADPFEECEDSNILGGDGCSARCTNEGAAPVGATCGNFDVAHSSIIGGEECDDGNTQSGDGCSYACLWEGSSSINPGVCGNGLIEPGEECDDSNTLNDDGCTDMCLFDGGLACPPSSSVSTVPSCCGNNNTDPINFEQCDGGEGCSSSCLLLGSSIDYAIPSICGDGTVNTGEHALCEASVGDGRVDGVQYAEVSSALATQAVPTTGFYTTEISATAQVTPPKSDSATLSVECSCEASNECPTGGESYACGISSGCCSARPDEPGYQPPDQSSSQCRNVEVRVVFDVLMDHDSMYAEGTIAVDPTTGNDVFTPGDANILLENINAASQTACDALGSHVYMARGYVEFEFLPHFANEWLTDALRWIRPEARALPQGCFAIASPVPVDVSGHTEVVLRYNVALAPNANYSIKIVGDANPFDAIEEGVLTADGAGFNARIHTDAIVYQSGFSTQSEICKLDYVSMTDTDGNGAYFVADETHMFQAAGLSQQGNQVVGIIPITGVYDWDYEWSVAPTQDVVAIAGDGVGFEEDVSSLQENGMEYVSVIATVTNDAFFDPTTVGDEVGTSKLAQVYICEIPWPGDVDGDELFDIFRDTDTNNIGLAPSAAAQYTNFQTAYCRAVTAPVSVTAAASSLISIANAQSVDVLPNFVISEPSVFTRPDVVREIFVRHPDEAEVVGIRVLQNPDFMPLAQWYAVQGFTGSPTNTTVDGYNALLDGRTVYINGVNRLSTGELEALIYAISYSENAGPETVDVFNQIVSNFSLHASETVGQTVTNLQVCVDSTNATINPDGAATFLSCSSNIECIELSGDLAASCNADVDKIRRDLSRFEDFREIEATISNYGDTHRHCSATSNLICIEDSNCPTNETCNADVPLLDAGTFIRGWSTSAWPSWGAELGNSLATGLPSDPVNQFGYCTPQPGACSVNSAVSCNSDGDCPDESTGETCLDSGFDPATCWDGNLSIHQCPADSHVYRYQRSGIEDYTLAVDLEATTFQWNAPFVPLVTSSVTDAQATFLMGGNNAPSISPVANTCNGLISYGASEVCGDGVIGGLEVCEIGQTSAVSCTTTLPDGTPTDGVEVTVCDTSSGNECSGFVSTSTACIPFSCGNGVVEGACVGGPNPGSACLSDPVCGSGGTCSSSFSVTGVEQCDDGEFNGLYGFCGTDCTNNASTSLQCGNGAVEGPEACDCGNSSSSQPSTCTAINGVYNIDGLNCAWDCSGPAPSCGDGIVTGGEQCDTEFESWAGALCDGSQSPCSVNSDCPTGQLCGSDSTIVDPDLQACPQAGFCIGGDFDGYECNTATGATAAGNCADASTSFGNPGVCSSFNTFRTRSCNIPSSSLQCNWDTWSDCEQQGSCRNGIPEEGEQCDDGNSVNTDSCTNICQLNVCGDGFLYPATESCDLGTNNGELCDPAYSGTCSYCTPSCSYQTVSGGYCGDGEVQLAGGELCDGSAPLHWVVTTAGNGLDVGDVGGVCDEGGAMGDTDVDGSDESQCRPIGACNGGEDNGDSCVPGFSYSNELGSFLMTGLTSCAGENTCVTQQCDAGCGSACPFNYQTLYAQATEYWTETDLPIVGAGPTDTVELFSSSGAGTCLSPSNNVDFAGIPCHTNTTCGSDGSCLFTNAPDYAKLTVPECSVASGLQADVTFGFEYSPLEVVFVLDYSGSMGQGLVPNLCDEDFCTLTPTEACTQNSDCSIVAPTRQDAMEDALAEAVENIFDNYPGPKRVGLVTFGGSGMNLDEPRSLNNLYPWIDNDDPSSLQDEYDSLYVEGHDCLNEPYRSSTSDNRYAYDVPEDWNLIVGDDSSSTDNHEDVGACIHYWPDDDIDDILNNAIPSLPTHGGGTPTAAGLNRAMYMLQQFPASHERVIVLMSDGAPLCGNGGENDPSSLAQDPLLSNGDPATAGPPSSRHPDCAQVAYRVYRYSGSIKNQGMKLYSALFMDMSSNNAKRAARSFEIFSSDCSVQDSIGVFGEDGLDPLPPAQSALMISYDLPDVYYGLDQDFPYNNRDYTPYQSSSTGTLWFGRLKTSRQCNDPLVYSYTGSLASDFGIMFDNIVDNIVGTTVLLTPESGASVSSVVIPGIGVSIPLPPGFVCTPNPQYVNVSIDFAGAGTVTIGNFRFLHCSE